MTGGVLLKALHRRHEHAGQPQGQSRTATTPKKNVISSEGVNMTDQSVPLDGVLTPVSPEDALMASHQASSSSSTSTNSSTSSTPNTSPVTSPGLPPVPSAPRASTGSSLLPHKKKHVLGLRRRSSSLDASRSRSSCNAASAGTQAATTRSPSTATPPAVTPALRRFPSRIELRAQYDRHGQLVRAVEEFYDHDATMPCLAYGTPPGPVGSDAFGRPPPYM